MRHLGRDVRYAWRGLVGAPVFTAVVLVSLALGIGANTAIFSLVDQVLLRTLPVTDPSRLVLFTQLGPHYGNNNGYNATSYPMYEDFRDAFVDLSASPKLPRISLSYDLPAPRPIFSGLFCRYSYPFTVGVGGRTERVRGELVSGTYFQVLGVGATVGRVITPADDRERGGAPVAVLSYEYWRNRFGADPHVVGTRILVNNFPLTVIGVSTEGFDGVDIGSVPSVRVPMTMLPEVIPLQADRIADRRTRFVNVFGRLEPGVTADQAKALLQPYFHSLRELEMREPAFSRASTYTRDQFMKGTLDLLPAARGQSILRLQLTQPLWLLMGTVALVLLIACANVAGLLIARAAARQKEIAVRLALGASRSRIVGQLLVESLMLAGAGGLLGVFVAGWTTRFLLRFLPSNSPIAISASLDGRILAFCAALSILTGLLFGLVPALRATRPSLAPTLKDQVGTIAGGGVTARKALVIAQVTLSVLLLIGAGLFIRSLRNLRLVDLGLRPESLVAFDINPSLSGYAPARQKQFYQTLLDRVRTKPGVTAASTANMAIFEDNEWDSTVTIEGYAAQPGENMNPYCNAVSPDYFRALGIPLLEGRDFDQRDVILDTPPPTTTSPPPYKVAIANQSFVKHYFGDANPIGRHLGFGGNPGTPTPIEIIGVVGDAKYRTVRADIPRQLFFPVMEDAYVGEATVYVRTTGDPTTTLGAAQQAAREIDPNVPVYNLRTMEEQIDRSLLNARLIATLSTAFGLLATLLAIIGLYGVMAYTVTRRTREIGVRMALGAVTGDVIWLVMREVFWLVGAGLTGGLVIAWIVSRLVQAQLYGVSPTDPVAVVAAVAALGVVALMAGYLPAYRATRVNPVTALRYE